MFTQLIPLPYRCLKNVVHQIDSKNEWLLLSVTFGAVTLEIYSTFYHNNYGNYNFIADTQCDRYDFYVNESIQICMISGETFPVKANFNHAWRHDKNLL